MSRVGVVVGNPKPQSRTLHVADVVATAAETSAGLEGAERLTVDLAELGPELFDWSSARVRETVEAVKGCALLVVASPTYKASYTGLLKSFLDWFGSSDLTETVAVPVMVGAGLQHALAVEVHLRPVLVELGACVPTRGLFVLEEELGVVGDLVEQWLHVAGPRLRDAVTRAV